MAPIHEAVDQRAVAAVGADALKRLVQKICEFGFGHFPGSHRELAMACLSVAGYVSIDFDVVGRVGKYRGALLGPQRDIVARRIERAPAIKFMLAEQP